MSMKSTRRRPAAPTARDKRNAVRAGLRGGRHPPSSRPEEALRLYDFAPAMFILLDMAGLIVDINQTGCDVLGKSREEVKGLPLRMWIADHNRADFLEHLRRCRTGEDPVESEMSLRSADGGTILGRFYSKWCQYRRRRAFATVVVDLTEYVVLERARKIAERERDRAEQERQLARAGEAAKDRLIATVSHELRNPLTPALVAADVLASWSALPDRARQLAGVIKRNIELEAHLIDDLLDLARSTRGKLQFSKRPLDVHQVLLDAINASATAAEAKSIAISIDLQAWTHFVRADEGRLRQVFGNILNNAIKFSDPDGAIIIRTTSDADEIVRIMIRDQGMGMDDETLARLFRPFEQQAQPGGLRSGLGLGLTICQSIIEGHGGRIWASSDGPGCGSTFEIELVSCERPAEPVQSAAGGRQRRSTDDDRMEPARVPQTVLIVEDHPDSGTLMSVFLSQHGYDVTLAQTLADGLAQLDRGWDVVLADIGLVDGSGLDLARRARSLSRPPGRMVAVSGFGSAADIAASHEAGFHEHLVKPVDLAKLLQALQGEMAPVTKR
jgi:PAS domain S-box-containing protein